MIELIGHFHQHFNHKKIRLSGKRVVGIESLRDWYGHSLNPKNYIGIPFYYTHVFPTDNKAKQHQLIIYEHTSGEFRVLTGIENLSLEQRAALCEYMKSNAVSNCKDLLGYLQV